MAKERTSKAAEKKIKKKVAGANVMRNVEIEKVVLNCGGVEDKLEKSFKLLGILTGKKIKRIKSRKRIPTFGVRPGLETGCMVTIRGDEKEDLLSRLLAAVDKKIKKSQIKENHFSFGIKEYLEIPNMEYQRDIGIIGLDVTVVFRRKGKRIEVKKIKFGKLPKRQRVSPEEIIDILKNKFNVEVTEGRKIE